LYARGATVLDPHTAVRLPRQKLRSTAYVANRLIVPAAEQERVIGMLTGVSREHGLRVVAHRTGRRRTAIAVRLEPDGQAASPDAWPVLQEARATYGLAELAGVGLDHLVGVDYGGPGTGAVGGTPHDEPHGPTAMATLGGYAWWAYAGPRPVAVVMPPPARNPNARHRPVVAVVDTGCGDHPWLAQGVYPDVAGLATTPETGTTIEEPMYGVAGPGNGHGTRICGLIRQICPDADLLPASVFGADGYAAESDLIAVLEDIRNLADDYLKNGPGNGRRRVDVLNLSCGYYPEELEDPTSQTMLMDVLGQLGKLGVAVVASAGNDATTRPTFPAAFAPHTDGPVKAEYGRVPLVSVGALNPDGTVALFSNSGAWVLHYEVGAAVVSPMPTSFDFSVNPAVSTQDPNRGRRQSIDPDRYRGVNDGEGGFAISSGTSFAAPVLAARIAKHIAAGWPSDRDDDPAGCAPSVDRGWAAIQEFIGIERP
jgi:hypothetical protein